MGFKLEVSGEYACFSRPELKVERVSYDVITPSAARGVFEAILWKPAIKWVIDEIVICNEIKFDNIRRNEVSDKASSGKEYIAASDKRQQRAAMVLKDVRYIITAHFEMTSKAGERDNPAKFAEMFNRRAKSGQCYSQPYLGTREFPAKFRLIEDKCPPAINQTRPLGIMLYDINYQKDKEDNVIAWEPNYFRADMVDGIINLRNVEVLR